MKVLRSGSTHMVIRGDLARLVRPSWRPGSAVPLDSAMAHAHVADPWEEAEAPWPPEVEAAAQDGPGWTPPDWARDEPLS